jgi:hypothetical protein
MVSGSLLLYAADQRSITAFASSAGPATARVGNINISAMNVNRANCAISASLIVCQQIYPKIARLQNLSINQTLADRRLASLPATSGLPRTTDIVRPARLVRFVPILLQKSVEGFREQ